MLIESTVTVHTHTHTHTFDGIYCTSVLGIYFPHYDRIEVETYVRSVSDKLFLLLIVQYVGSHTSIIIIAAVVRYEVWCGYFVSSYCKLADILTNRHTCRIS
jgi:phosphotransferase system  glucose/maltose/N-acetylglucosamine-specific IIC component